MLRIGVEKSVLRVVNDQRGAPTSAGVLAAIVTRLIDAMAGDANGYLRRHGGILHAACTGETTWHGFAVAIFDEAGKRGRRLAVKSVQPIATADYPTPATRPAYSVLDLSRLTGEFGIAPLAWRDALNAVMEELPQ
jgi:dTDP-4-dehydrorhamnose reductase